MCLACAPFPSPLSPSPCQSDGDCPGSLRCDRALGYCFDPAQLDAGAAVDAGGEPEPGTCILDALPTSPRIIFRSVGPNRIVPLAASDSAPITRRDLVVEFAQDLPAAVGVGDVIQHDTDGDAAHAYDSLAFVVGRLDARHLVVADADGRPLPAGTVVSPRWSICRAYTSLARAVQGSENRECLDDALQDFDTFGSDHDLVARDVQWNIACYGDGTDVEPVPGRPWITDPGHRVSIFTPTSACQVGASQRHAGVWNDSRAYRLEAELTGWRQNLLGVGFMHASVVGLQVGIRSAFSEGAAINVARSYPLAGETDVTIRQNLVRATLQSGAYNNRGIAFGGGSLTKIYNNVVWGLRSDGADDTGIGPWEYPGGRNLVIHNTVVDCSIGIVASAETDFNHYVNNLAAGNGTDYSDRGRPAAFDLHAHNLSADQSSPDAEHRGQAVLFVDGATRDYHLAAADSAARDRGLDLSADANLPVADDIDGDRRPQGAGADLGADEAR